jgi:hypothetical protein
MTDSDPGDIASLLSNYERIGVAMYDESLNDTVTKYNKLFKQWRQTVEKLDTFGPDARLRLKPFLSHPNLQLRMNTAYDVYDIDPQGSLAVFREIAASNKRPQSVDASIALERRDPTYKG